MTFLEWGFYHIEAELFTRDGIKECDFFKDENRVIQGLEIILN